MFKQNVTLLIVLIVLGASALGYFIVQDLRSNTNFEGKPTDIAKEPAEKKPDSEPPRVAVSPLPDLDRAIMYKALVREEDKPKIEAEIKIISQTLKDTPDYLDGWLQLGLLRKYIGDYEGAVLAWEYAAKIRPKDYVAFNNLGDIYHFYLKDLLKSESAIKKVIELKPDYTPAYKNLFELYTFSYKEKISLADDALIDGITKNPKVYDLMVALAMYYKENGDKTGARKYFEMALKLNPPNKSAIEAELNAL